MEKRQIKTSVGTAGGGRRGAGKGSQGQCVPDPSDEKLLLLTSNIASSCAHQLHNEQQSTQGDVVVAMMFAKENGALATDRRRLGYCRRFRCQVRRQRGNFYFSHSPQVFATCHSQELFTLTAAAVSCTHAHAHPRTWESVPFNSVGLLSWLDLHCGDSTFNRGAGGRNGI